MKHSLLFAVAFVGVCASAAVFAQAPQRAKSDSVAEQCTIVATRATGNIASKRLLEAASVRITGPLMRACTTAGRIMVSKTTVPLRGTVAHRRTAESGMFSLI